MILRHIPLAKCGVLAICGFVISTLVAWGSALFMPREVTFETLSLPGYPGEHYAVYTTAFALRNYGTEIERRLTVVELAGWPMLCWRRDIVRSEEETIDLQPTDFNPRKYSEGHMVHYKWKNWGARNRTIPVVPMAVPTVVNTLFWGCVSFGMYQGGRFAGQRILGSIRSRRGLCPRCGYRAAALARCPECGTGAPVQSSGTAARGARCAQRTGHSTG